MKLEIRNPNFETRPKFEIQMLKTGCVEAPFENFEFQSFGFVSDFDIQASNFLPS